MSFMILNNGMYFEISYPNIIPVTTPTIDAVSLYVVEKCFVLGYTTNDTSKMANPKGQPIQKKKFF